MFIADVEIKLEYGEYRGLTLMCLCMDVGLLPHSFPLPIFSEFPPELSVTKYIGRQKQISITPYYFPRLQETLAARAINRNTPVPAYVRPSWFVPQPIPPVTAEKHENQSKVQTSRECESPEDDICLFVTDHLVFEDAILSLNRSAKTVGAGMLEVSFLWLNP